MRSFGGSTLGGFLGTLGSFLLSTRLLLGALHFGFLLTARGFFGLALRHFLSATFRFLLGAHLLFFGSTACLLLRTLIFGLLLTARGFFGLALHGSGLSLLANTFSGGLFGGQAFSISTLLLGCHILLRLRGDCCGLLTCFFSLGGGLLGGQTLLLCCHILLLLRGDRCGLLACFFSLSGCLFSRHALLLGGHILLLLCGDCCGLLACFFSLSSCLFSGLFLCHGTLLQFPLLALIHGRGLSLICRSTLAGLFGCRNVGTLIVRHFFCWHGRLRDDGSGRLLRHDLGWSTHDHWR